MAAEGGGGGGSAFIRLESAFKIDPQLMEEVWQEYTSTNEEKFFRDFVRQFVNSWEQRISPNWEMLITSKLQGYREVGPNLRELPDELLAALSKFLFIGKESEDGFCNLESVSESKDIIKVLTILCRCSDNIPLIASMDFVKYLTEMCSRLLVDCLQVESSFFQAKAKKLGRVVSQIRVDTIELIEESCHFFESLYDPGFCWRSYLCEKTGQPRRGELATSSALHQEVIPFLYESFETALVDRFPMLAKEMLNVFGAIISGGRHNALRAISPATSKMLLKTIRDSDTGDDVHISAIYCSTQSISIMEQTPPHERQIDVSILINQYQKVILSLSERGHNLSNIIEGVSLLTRMLEGSSLELKEAFVKNGILETLLAVTTKSLLNDDLKKVLLSVVINRISLILTDCDVACQRMDKIHGYSTLFDIISGLGPPDNKILHSVLFMATHGCEGNPSLCGIQNVKPLIYLLRWIIETDYENVEQQVWLTQSLRSLCTSNLQNKALCCESGIILEAIRVLKSFSRLESRSASEILRLLESLGKYSISPYELKQLISLLNDENDPSTPDSQRGKFPYKSHIIHVISSMAKGDGFPVCRQYLDFNGQQGIEVPSIGSWTGGPTNGFTFHTWIRLESNGSSNREKSRRILYSLYTRQGQGFEAFIHKGKLVVASAHKEEFLGVPLEDQIPYDDLWHSLSICHGHSRRPFKASTLAVYMDGSKRFECALKYPLFSVTDPLAHCVIGMNPSVKKEMESLSSQPKPSLKDGIIDAIKLGIPGVINLPHRSNDPHVKWTLIGLETEFWGKPCPFIGQLGCIYVFQEALSPSQAKTLHSMGPVTPMPPYLLKEDDHSEELLGKLVFGFSPRARVHDTLIDLHKGLFSGKISPKVFTQATHDVRNVLNCLGGVQVLFPLLESVKIKEQGELDELVGYLSLSEIQNKDPKQQLQTQISSTSEQSNWVLLPNSSFSDWKLEQNPISGFLTLIRNLVSDHVVNLEQLNRGGGVAIIGALIQRADPALIDVNVLMACQLLIEMAATSSNLKLLSAMHQCILFDFKIWSKAEFTVQIGHIQYIRNTVKSDKKFFRKRFGIQFFMDAIRRFYLHSESLSFEDTQTVRKALFGIIKIYLTKDGKDVSPLCSFLLSEASSQEITLASEVVELINDIFLDPAVSTHSKDQIYRALKDENRTPDLFCSLIKSPLENRAYREAILRLIKRILNYRKRKAHNARLFLEGSYLGYLSLRFEEKENVDKGEVPFLLDIALYGSSTVDTVALIGLLNNLTYFPTSVKHVVCRRILKLLQEQAELPHKIALTRGWQRGFTGMLVKEKSSFSTEEDLPSLEPSAKAPDVISVEEGINVIHGENGEKLGLLAESERRIWEFETLNLDEFDGGIDPSELLSRSSSSEDLSSSTAIPSLANESSLDAESSSFVLLDEEDSTGDEVSLCEMVLEILHKVMTEGLSGKLEDIIDQRGQVIASITMLGLNNELYKSVIDIKRSILERFSDSLLSASGSSLHYDHFRHIIRWTYDWIVNDNQGVGKRRITRHLVEGAFKLAKSCLASENITPECSEHVTKMTLEVLLKCAEYGDFIELATDKLVEFIGLLKHVEAATYGFLIHRLSGILAAKLHIPEEEEEEYLSPLLKALRTILRASRDALNLTSEIPSLTNIGEAFDETFKSYVFEEEWKYFIEKKMVLYKKDFEAGTLESLPIEMDEFWAEAFERNKDSNDVFEAATQESKRLLRKCFLEPLENVTRLENQRYHNTISQHKSRIAFVNKRWKVSKRLFFGPRGAWYNLAKATTCDHWKLSFNENYLRMRMKLVPNMNYKSHFMASGQRDNIPSGKGSLIQELGEKLKEATDVKGKDPSSTDEHLSEEDLKSIAREQFETDDEKKTGQKRERILISEDSELVTYMSVIKGKFELTTSYIYFFDTSIGDEEKEWTEERKDIRISLLDIHELHLRRFNLRQSGMEIFLVDHMNHFFNFSTQRKRNKVFSRILGLCNSDVIYSRTSPMDTFRESGLTSKWVNREISNFEYLVRLNTLAGRSFNDLSQYPVFPWILSDYSSPKLDLSNPATFRDLSKPIGIQNSRHVEEVQSRYESFEDPSGVISKFHYGTHYSNSAMVLHYLVRVEPFTSLHIDLQSGRFDVADRQFHSIPQSWKSLLSNVNDVKELIPEFFYFPEFLVNANNFDLGVLQGSKKTRVNDAVLPPWAEDPWDFIRKHREALESDYVSLNLHHWIDLIFGYKQMGEEAIKALNVFYYCTYEGAVNLDRIIDPAEREALEGMINNFGQTPCQLLKEPHPQRLTSMNSSGRSGNVLQRSHLWRSVSLNVSSEKDPASFAVIPKDSAPYANSKSILTSLSSNFHSHLLLSVTQSAKVSTHCWTLDKKESSFLFDKDPSSDEVRCIPGPFVSKLAGSALAVTPDGKYLFCGGTWDNSISVYSIPKSKVLSRVIKHDDIVTCLSLDPLAGCYMISGSRDTTSIVWQIRPGGDLSPFQVLAGHDKPVTCVAISFELDVAVSGSKDGSVNVYSVKEGIYIRTIYPPVLTDDPFTISLIQLSYNGAIIFSGHCTQTHSLHVFTLNGHYLRSITSDHRITSLLSSEEVLLSGDENGNLVLRTIQTLETLKEFPLLLPISGLSLSPDGAHILVPLRDGKLIVISDH